jgi:type I restriction enzyme S subunit
MEVKPGYKKTEVGVIPENWVTASLLQIAQCLDNVRVPIKESQRLRMQGDIPYCGANGVLGFVDDYVIDDDIILMAEDGGYFDEYETRPIAYRMKGKCWVNNHAHILKAKPGFDQGFLYFSLVHKNIMPFLASGTRAKLNKSEMEKILVPAPPSEAEQCAIASALSDVDGLLGGLDRLIAKKRDLKQAAMQQLLTGQTRLPGFHGEWELKPIGTITARLPKTTRLSSDGKPEGRFPFFTNSTQPVDKYLDEKDFDQEVIIANTGGVAYFDYFNGSFAAMSDCMVLTAQINTKWLFYVLKSLEYYINNKGFTGSGIKHLDKEYFFGLSIRTPKSSDEQASIAYIITDIDSELEALEARRDKTRELKHAMMQELLTGRIRLLQPEALNA